MNEFFMQPSQSTTIFGRVDLSEALEPLARAGYRHIELSRKSWRRAENKPMADDLGLRVWAVHGTLDLIAGIGTSAERQEAVDDELRAMDDVAVYAPCPYIVHHFCRNTDPDGVDDWKLLVEPLHERAKSLGFVLALEQLPVGSAFPYVCKSAAVAEFVRSFDSEHVGLCVDFNHVNLVEDFTTVARNSAGIIRTIHISDNHGIREEHLPPGEGIIAWPEALSAIYDAGYEGPLNMELHVPPTHELLVSTREWAERMADELASRVSIPGEEVP